jgi:transposase
MRANTLDLRERVVKFVAGGGTRAQAAQVFRLGARTVYRYLAAAKTNTLPPKTSWGTWRKLDPAQLSARVKKHPDATLWELQAVFGVSHNALWVRLRQLGFTLKKLIKYRARNEGQRWRFRRELKTLPPARVYYLDECGVDHRLYREYGRAPRGEPIYATVAGRRRERTSVIAACQNGRLVAPLTFAGTGNTEVVDAYFAQVLLPVLPPGSVIVLDNARFHQSPTTAALVKQAGCALRFLPAYSPDLNPIEHLWAAVKTRRRQGLPAAPNPALLIGITCLPYC